MITGPLFKWFGSKWSASVKYPPPKYRYLVEPFAGSAGYALRYAHLHVTIFDVNPYISSLWKWLIQTATHNEIISIPLNIQEKTDIRTLDLSDGQKLLLKTWQRTNNTGNCWTISPWGNLPGQWSENTRTRVAREVEHIKHWKFKEIDYQEHHATYFIDPPYQYNYDYQIKNFDFQGLARNIMSIPAPAQIIACEALCPKTKKEPDWLQFDTFAKRVTSRRKEGNHTHSYELMYYEERMK